MEMAGFRSGIVTIIGAPNVGKSTLLNAIMGTKLAIVTPKPQTTRNRILGVKNVPQGQLVFLDTPGIHMPRTKLNHYMMQAVTEALSDPQVVLYMTDVSRAPYPDLAFLQRTVGHLKLPIFWVLNKIDLIERQQLLPLIAGYADREAFAEILPLAARQGEGVEHLLTYVLQHMPEGPRYFPDDIPTDRDERFFIAELIREQAMLRTHEEVPYAIAVDVESVQERHDGSVEIDAAFLVEKDSQKGILVGQHGRMIKELGIHAREAITRLLHCPVHLRLIVRVKKNWREHEATLRDLGFKDI